MAEQETEQKTERKAGRKAERRTEQRPAPRLKARYREEIRPTLQRELGLSNIMQVPGLEKIVVNMGVGDAIRDAKMLDAAVADLAVITGQKAAVRRARKSIAAFKLREGMSIGAMVTLRGDRMYEFFDRLVNEIGRASCRERV